MATAVPSYPFRADSAETRKAKLPLMAWKCDSIRSAKARARSKQSRYSGSEAAEQLRATQAGWARGGARRT